MPRPFNTSTPLGQIMARKGWSVTELAVVSGIHNVTISAYLSGRKQITAHHAWPISEALGIEVSDILPVDVARGLAG